LFVVNTERSWAQVARRGQPLGYVQTGHLLKMKSDNNYIDNCCKCLTIIGMTEIMHGYPREALKDFQKAVNVVKRDTGSVPAWLMSRVDVAAAEAAKQNR